MDKRAYWAFDSSRARLDEARDECYSQLVAAQLENWPDSRILTLHQVYETWAFTNEAPIDFDKFATSWDQYHGTWYLDDVPEEVREKARARREAYNRACNEHKHRMLTCIALMLQYPVVVWYECGKRDDGTYAYRGCRFGVEGSQYSSGFPSIGEGY